MYQCYDEVAISNKPSSHDVQLATNARKYHPKKKPYLFQNRANTEYYVTRKNNLPICYIRAIRDIKRGEELFVDYGDQYWRS
jgi:SET domain-containing protein